MVTVSHADALRLAPFLRPPQPFVSSQSYPNSFYTLPDGRSTNLIDIVMFCSARKLVVQQYTVRQKVFVVLAPSCL